MHFLALVVFLSGSSALAAEHASWDEYAKAHRYSCPGPFDTLKAPRTLTLGGKTYAHSGYKLQVQGPDADATIKLGVLSAIKDTTSATQQNLKEAIAWFKAEGVEWVVVNGDIALEEFDLEENMQALGESGLPTLLLVGNSESKSSFARTYRNLSGKYPNLVNGNWVRQLVLDDVELWTMPGYHDKRFVHQGAGCVYGAADIDAMAKLERSSDAPVVLVAHGPPAGKGKGALDYTAEKKNVGDALLATLLAKAGIRFGLFGHILEAGGVAVGDKLAGAVAQGKLVDALYLNAGSLSGDPWGLNDGSTATGMAFVVTIEGQKAKYQGKRFKPQVSE